MRRKFKWPTPPAVWIGRWPLYGCLFLLRSYTAHMLLNGHIIRGTRPITSAYIVSEYNPRRRWAPHIALRISGTCAYTAPSYILSMLFICRYENRDYFNGTRGLSFYGFGLLSFFPVPARSSRIYTIHTYVYDLNICVYTHTISLTQFGFVFAHSGESFYIYIETSEAASSLMPSNILLYIFIEINIPQSFPRA